MARRRTVGVFANRVRPVRHLIEDGGLLLAIDPAGGSSSNPGWSLWKSGELVDSGAVRVKGNTWAARLQQIRVEFEQLPKPDVVAIEQINDRMSRYLHNAVGLLAGMWDCPVVEVPVMCWKVLVPHWPDYKKDDEWDAILLGYAVIYELNKQN